MTKPTYSLPIAGTAPNQTASRAQHEQAVQAVVDSLWASLNPSDAQAAQLSAQQAAASADTASAAATTSTAAAFQAELSALAAGAPIVTSLTSPVPANGTVELLRLDAGLQVHEVESGSWELRGWLVGPTFDTVALLLDSPATTLGPEGQIIEAGDLQFAVASSSAVGASVYVTDGGVRLRRIFPTDRSLPASPLRNVELVDYGSPAVTPLDVLADGRLYGAVSGAIYVSDDDGDNWTLINSNPGGGSGTVRGFRDTQDGEVLLLRGGRLLKSSGWASNPATAGWTTVLTADNDGIWRQWGVKTYPEHGSVCVAAPYGGQYEGYRAYKSENNGDTWTEVFSTPAGFHQHCMEADPYDDWTLYLTYHAGPGSANPSDADRAENGTYYSTDGGSTWARVPWNPLFEYGEEVSGSRPHPDPTTLDALPGGIILGSDYQPNGIWRIPRVPKNDPRWRIEPILRVREDSPLLNLVAREGRVSPKTGLYYVSANGTGDQLGYLFASDGVQAWEVWRQGDTVRIAGITRGGRMVGRVNPKGGGDYQIWRCDEPLPGAAPAITVDDPGQVLGGKTGGQAFNVAVGVGSDASDARPSPEHPFAGVCIGAATGSGVQPIAIGAGTESINRSFAAGTLAFASGEAVALGLGAFAGVQTGQAGRAVVIGRLATNNSFNAVVALGQSAEGGGAGAVCVGPATKALGVGAVAIADRAEASANYAIAIGRHFSGSAVASVQQAIAIGGPSEATGQVAVAVGAFSKSTGNQSVAYGGNAEATALRATAVGHGAEATHTDGVAIGEGSETTQSNQVAIGTRYLEMGGFTSDRLAPPADHVAIFFRRDLNELRVRFPDGTVKTIADAA